MMEYFTTDNIAIYGAIVATLAFVISFVQYLHNRKDKIIQFDMLNDAKL